MKGNVLFLGGDFSIAGNKISANFAVWQPRVNLSQMSLGATPGAVTVGNDVYGFCKPSLDTMAGTAVSYSGGLPVVVRMDRADEIQVGGKRVNGAVMVGPDGVQFGGSGTTLRVEFSEDDVAAYGLPYTDFVAVRLAYPADYPTNKEAAACTQLTGSAPTPIRIENGKQIYAISAPVTEIGATYGAVPSSIVSGSGGPDPWKGFAEQPQNIHGYGGNSYTLSVNLGWSAPGLTYTWWHMTATGPEIVGGNGPQLTLPSGRPSDSGTYWCDVTLGGVLHRTNTVTVSVADPLVIVQQPYSAVIGRGKPFSFGVLTTGGVQPVSYQWWKDGKAVPGATDSMMEFASPDLIDSGMYSVEVWDAGADAVSSRATELTVLPCAVPVGGIAGLVALVALIVACAARVTKSGRVGE